MRNTQKFNCMKLTLIGGKDGVDYPTFKHYELNYDQIENFEIRGIESTIRPSLYDNYLDEEYSCKTLLLDLHYHEVNQIKVADGAQELGLGDYLAKHKNILSLELETEEEIATNLGTLKGNDSKKILVPWNFRNHLVNENMIVKINKKVDREEIMVSADEKILFGKRVWDHDLYYD